MDFIEAEIWDNGSRFLSHHPTGRHSFTVSTAPRWGEPCSSTAHGVLTGLVSVVTARAIAPHLGIDPNALDVIGRVVHRMAEPFAWRVLQTLDPGALTDILHGEPIE